MCSKAFHNDYFQKTSSILAILFFLTVPGSMAISKSVPSMAGNGHDRFVQVLTPHASNQRVSRIKWVFIAQYDADGIPLPMVSLGCTDYLEISRVTVNHHKVLVTGIFRGNLFSGGLTLEAPERRAAFFFTIDEYGTASHPTVLYDTVGDLAVSLEPADGFFLLAYRYVNSTSLQIAKWHIGWKGQHEVVQSTLVAEGDSFLLENAQGSEPETKVIPPVIVPIDNTEDPEG